MRHWIQGTLPRCEPLFDLMTIGGELAGNSVMHTSSGLPGASFSVQVGWSAEHARVVVGDRGAASEPTVNQHPTDTGGRGLAMVTELASRWGIAGSPRGRWVWADVPWAPEDRQQPPEPGSGNPTAKELARLQGLFPGSRIWFSDGTKTWWALPPATASLIEASAPAALHQMLAATWPVSPEIAYAAPRPPGACRDVPAAR